MLITEAGSVQFATQITIPSTIITRSGSSY